jgi:topoisomerase-4 subunit A
VRVRAKISQLDKKTLVINQIPYSTNTSSLIDSILKANDKGKIKIKRIEDNTAADVEILVHLPAGISPDKTIDALYAFTACESSISPLGCVIEDNKPLFVGVSEMLRRSTDHTVELLTKELEYQLQELENQWHFSSLERIFIENRIYRDIEEVATWEGVIEAIQKGLSPFTSALKREVTVEDIVRLTEIRIKRISKFDIDKAQQKIEALEGEIEQVKHSLANIIEFAIAYFTKLKTDYGKGRERKTEIKTFDDVDARKVVIRNTKLYVNREEGFVGTSLRKDEYVTDCSDIDDIIVFTEEGKMMVTKVDTKTFVGKNILHLAVFKKKDTRTIYNMIYRDGKSGTSYIKRFAVTGVTRDKEYGLTQGNPGSKVLYFSANPNGEAEIVSIILRQSGSIKKLKWDLDFADLDIKGRGVKGNIVTKYRVNRIELKEAGVSTLKPRKIWFDESVQRLNVDGRGTLVGAFRGDDKLLIIQQNGTLKTVTPDLSMHFPEDMIVMEQWSPKKPLSVIYFDGEKERYYVKRFLVENANKEETIVRDHSSVRLELVSTDWKPQVELVFAKPRGKEPRPNQQVVLEEFIDVKGIKALGNQLTPYKVKTINNLEPIPYDPPPPTATPDIEVNSEEVQADSSAKEVSSSNSDNSSDGEGQISMEL